MISALEKRKILKQRKPRRFIRTDTNKYNFKAKWRRPRGMHNKLRLRHAGHQKRPSPGYGSPKEAKYLHPSGYTQVLILNIKQLDKINPKTNGILIAGNVGLKNKLKILEAAKKLDIHVLNVKDIDAFINLEKDKLTKKKQEKIKIKDKKIKSKEESIKKAEEKQKKEEEKPKTKEEKHKHEIITPKSSEEVQKL